MPGPGHTGTRGSGSRDSDLERMRPAKIFRDSVQIEAAFRKYFHRDVDHKRKAKKDKDSEAPKEAMHPGQAPLTDAQEKVRRRRGLHCHAPGGRGSLHFHCCQSTPELLMMYGRSRGQCIARASGAYRCITPAYLSVSHPQVVFALHSL